MLLFLAFVIGDCVHINERLWWTHPTEYWVVIGIENGKYVLYNEMTVHNVPERMLTKCK